MYRMGRNTQKNLARLLTRQGALGKLVLAGALTLPVALSAVAAPAGATTKSAKVLCHSANGIAVTDKLVCKGLAYYKGKTVNLEANGAVGAVADALFRAAAPGVQTYLGANVIVSDNPNGAGIGGTNAAADAAPDGLTVGYLNLNQALANQSLHQPGVNFPLSKIKFVGGTRPICSLIVSNPNSGITTIQQLLSVTNPTAILETAGSSFINTVVMLIAAYHVVPAHIITGYTSSTNLVTGFLRGDGPVVGTAEKTLQASILSGQATPLVLNNPIIPGMALYQTLKNVPTIESLVKTYPPKTKAGKIVLNALIAYLKGGASFFIQPVKTPVYLQAAMIQAFKYSFSLSSTELGVSAGGAVPGLLPATDGPKYVQKGLKEEPTLAKFNV